MADHLKTVSGNESSLLDPVGVSVDEAGDEVVGAEVAEVDEESTKRFRIWVRER